MLTIKRRRDGVAVRAVDGKIAIPGSSRASDNFFFIIFFGYFIFRIYGRQINSAFAEDGGFFWAKKAPHFV